ncbi:MAG: anhydro-N-acetylmuramic acid kinase [Proteobacteria bacterium]|nr:anhydro-N-acetylmuramic acid kinase [Pseudomonadota bacterium]
MEKKLFIGLMSGTSMDGIDAALVEVEKNHVIDGITVAYQPEIKARLNALLDSSQISLKELSELNTLLGQEFARATLQLLAKVKVDSSEINAIGSHGQTVCHDANAAIPYTLQLGCAHTIAEKTGIQVVADFRTRDLVNGGKGAPFAPIYHQLITKNQSYPLALVNIGGIANITYLSNENEVLGYDVGPGNCLLDAWIYKNKAAYFDDEGKWAASGKIIEPLLNDLLSDPFFALEPPKSIGKEYFSLAWLNEKLRPNYLKEDIQATLLMLTARGVADSLKKYPMPKALYLCGGGVHNKTLYKTLKNLLPELKVESSALIGIDPNYLEAAMFAWFAERAVKQIPLQLQSITGVKKKAIYGVIYPV